MSDLAIIGGGLAGSEAAWQAAKLGLTVDLFEMRPRLQTGAHQSSRLAELVCSNSLGSKLVDRASGLLKEEIRRMGSLLLECAQETALPAGEALAVDREAFAELVTARIEHLPNIRIRREEVKEIPSELAVIASGPLTSPALSGALASLTGKNHLYFYDAVAPVITYEFINMDIAFRGSRYDHGQDPEGDYLNSPLNKEEYERFISALLEAERVTLLEFEKEIENGVRGGPDRFFEGCLPIEILAKRGSSSLAFGPLRPVGLKDPRTGKRPYAVVQLRQDNLAGSLYNLVGFQTNLKFPEQRRVSECCQGWSLPILLASVRCTGIHLSFRLHSCAQLSKADPAMTCFLPGRSLGSKGISGISPQVCSPA